MNNLPNEGMRQLLAGYRNFFNGNPVRKGFCALHAEQIADTQNPHSMVVSCFDSRVCPEAIFDTNDGHICVHRNMLNQIDKDDFSMVASLRFAVKNLQVQNIVILGHSDCNAVAKLKHLEELPPELRAWLDRTHTCYRGDTLEEAVKNNVLDQLAHLQSIDFVAQDVASRGLKLEGFYFHIDDGRMERYNAARGEWEFVSTEASDAC
ncbi:MAG: carbonic anhydrase [Candidatus Avelusimicrobium sp.]|uniref:carbonic anhydrase n=1 Tax=Candidatus Avelusimicrobium sp. TaxID=3048833 RepID=UPI003F0CB579